MTNYLDLNQKIRQECLLAISTTDINIQRDLAHFNHSIEVREHLADNPSLYPDIQQILAADALFVRRALAKNPALTKVIQEFLQEDLYVDVLCALLRNINLEPDVLRKLLTDDEVLLFSHDIMSATEYNHSETRKIRDNFLLLK